LRVLIIFWVLFTTSISFAEEPTEICGNSVISVGDSSFRVEEHCGKPTAKETVSGGGDVGVRVERWYYEKTSIRFGRIFTIVGGKVEKIEIEQ